MTLALFDFDGTLTRKDTLFDFLRFSFGTTRFMHGMLYTSPYLVAFKLGFYPNWRAKERVLEFFLGGLDNKMLGELAQRYVTDAMPDVFKADMLDKLRTHQRNGDTVIIVSASPEAWISLFAKNIGVAHAATRLAIRNGIVTGAIEGKNCYGPEKVARISELIDLKIFDQIFAYGDSRGDREMLALATTSGHKSHN